MASYLLLLSADSRVFKGQFESIDILKIPNIGAIDSNYESHLLMAHEPKFMRTRS